MNDEKKKGAEDVGTSSATNVSSAAPGAALRSSVDYKSSDIGVKTAVKVDPFAEHKANQEQQKQKRRKVVFGVGIVLVILIVAIAAIGLSIIFNVGGHDDGSSHTNSDDETSESGFAEEYIAIQNEAKVAYQESDNPNAAVAAFNTAVEDATTNRGGRSDAEIDKYVENVRLAQMSFYADNGLYDEMLSLKDELEPENLDARQRGIYYNCLYLAYLDKGDRETAERYSELTAQAAYEQDGGKGGGL